MRRSIVRIWILGCLATLLTALTSQALHIKGGWMSYKHMGVDANGNNLYVMTVKVYRDCAPANPQQNDVTINVTIYNNSAPGASAVNIPAPMSTSYRLEKTDWDPCINPRPQVCYVVLQYETGIFALPPSADGYTASFQRCCRINGIVNVAQPSNNLGNTYTISFPGTNPQASNAVNSSPIFKENDTEVVCYDSNIRLDYGASDPDGDSLAYFFLPAINGGSSNQPNPNTASRPPYPPLNYVNPYSPDDPFGTRLYLDPQTGIITGRSPSTTGEYVIAVGVNEFRNGTLIATSRKELHVSVANCGLAAAELPLRITSCNSYTVQFENLSPSPAILTYFWDFGVPNRTDDTSRNAIPVFTYPDTGVYRATLIINRNEACSDTATTEVAVYPGFTPGVRVEGSCFLNPFVFTDTTRAAFGTVNFWRWDFGNPLTSFDTSRLRNPQYTYPAPGTYNTTFIVGSSKGCLDTITVPVQVFNRPALTLPFKDTLICSIDTLPLIAIGTGNFSWSPSTNLINPDSPTPLVYPKDTITYYVTLNENGCVATDSIKVNVLDYIDVDAGPDTTICRGDGVVLRPVTDGLNFSWSPPMLLNNANLRNPIASPTDSLTTFIVVANLGKCQATDSVRIRTVPYPVANAGPDTTVCFGDPAVVRGQITGSSFSWQPANVLQNPGRLTSLVNTNQTITLTLIARDTLGCPKPGTDQVVINVLPRIQINAGNDTAVVIGQSLQLNATTNAPGIVWTPPVALSNPNIPNPTAVYSRNDLPTNGEYRYTVTGLTPEGCQASDEIIVKVFTTGPSIFVPNGFTPNGDGRNDVIRPVLVGMQTLDMFRVYNRYGQLVFETRQINKGWDGRLAGLPQGSGAYVYQAQATDFAGNVVKQSGTFVLIR